MTQFVRYGHMLKVTIDALRIRTRASWHSEGSVLAGTIASRCEGVESDIEIESPNDPALVAALVHSARGGCYAEAALTRPVQVTAAATLNGRPLDYARYPSRPPH